jgi:hypothetical protein
VAYNLRGVSLGSLGSVVLGLWLVCGHYIIEGEDGRVSLLT